MATHLLIPCTARKTVRTPEHLHMSQYQGETLQNTVSKWTQVYDNVEKKEATELYSGTAFRQLSQLSRDNGFKLHVISAGFGVISSNTLLPGYDASFTNSKAKVPSPSSEWWSKVTHSELPGYTIEHLFHSNAEDRFIICCSKEYLNVIQYDLAKAIRKLRVPEKNLVIISSALPPLLQKYKNMFIEANRKFKSYEPLKSFDLALTDRNIAALVTLHFVSLYSVKQMGFDDIIHQIYSDTVQLKAPKTPKRIKRDDRFIRSYIHDALKNQPTISCSHLLKHYQSEGNACTDTRFRNLFKSLKNS